MQLTKRYINKTDSGTYLKLGDGESVIGVFRGEIYESYIRWDEGKSKPVTKDAAGAKSRFKANFIVKEAGTYIAKVFEFSPTTYNQLVEINEMGPLEKTKVKIIRRGVSKDTVYMIMPSTTALTEGELLAIGDAKLNILDDKQVMVKQHAADGFAPPSEPDFNGPIFDDEKMPF